MFQVISENFFVPLASPNKMIYWECLVKLFSVMNHQLSFGVERDVLVQELQYYFEQEQAVSIEEEGFEGKNSRDQANWMLRRLEYYGWIEIETDKSYVQRVPRNDMVSCHLQMLEEYIKQNSTPVCRAFAEYLLERLTEHKSVKEYIQIENADSTRQLLNTIQAVEKNETQLYIREFSMIHFQDSKEFEKMENRVSHVLKKFKPNCEMLEYGEILAEYGIYHTPNYVYLKGNLIVSIGKEKIDLSSLKQGLGISGKDIGRIRFCNTDNIRKVITIENLTTYFRWQEDDSLLVYLGGYHNSVRRELLQEIYACCPKACYCHFGDIDAGGFEIYRDLCEKTGIPFEMYKMGLETLQLYENYGKRLTANDRKRLQGMRDRDGLQELIHYMLEHDVKLEQECIR